MSTNTLRGKRDTGTARLPGLPAVSTGNAALDAWLAAASERLEVREGQRGNAWERAVTQRELKALADRLDALQDVPDKDKLGLDAGGASIVISVGGMQATMAIKKFEDAIRATKLYQDLKKRLDDPSRFDSLRAEVREELLRDLRQMALAQGAQVQHVERIVHDMNLSIAMRIATVTAAAADAAAAVRELDFAATEMGRAQAGKITQLEASLGNYYQDGTPGRANLEESMTVTADRVDGLEGQYTLKVQAGGALAGFGLAATEKDGEPDSAFIIAANKFAIVNPETWSAGLTNTPDESHIPFGVDANGIYLNHNVYVKGLMRVDTGGKTLADGLRGSLDIEAHGSYWSDTVARNAIWKALGNAGSASNNNHLVIGDTVNIGGTVRQWMGNRWTAPGVVINGNMLVNGSVAADKIDTRGLTIKDDRGNVILGAGQKLDTSWLTGSVNIAPQAANSQVSINGQRIAVADLVSRLNRIGTGNISSFMESAAIGHAYIGNAAVDTLNIAGNAVTVPRMSPKVGGMQGQGWPRNSGTPTVWVPYHSYPYVADGDMFLTIIVCITSGTDGSGKVEYGGSRMLVDGNVFMSQNGDWNHILGSHTYVYGTNVYKGQTVTVQIDWGGESCMRIYSAHMIFLGTKR